MHHPIHRALVTYSDNTTGEIRIKIPSLLGAGSEVSISYIGRKSRDGVWSVPSIGDQIVVSSDDENMTNVFWLQTESLLNVIASLTARIVALEEFNTNNN